MDNLNVESNFSEHDEGRSLLLPVAKKKAPKVLIIDDYPMVQQYLSDIFTSLNCSVSVASDGVKALELFPAGFDLILMDMDLPDIESVSVIKIIRNFERVLNKYTPIIANVALIDDENLKRQCQEIDIDIILEDGQIKYEVLKSLVKYLLRVHGVYENCAYPMS